MAPSRPELCRDAGISIVNRWLAGSWQVWSSQDCQRTVPVTVCTTAPSSVTKTGGTHRLSLHGPAYWDGGGQRPISPYAKLDPMIDDFAKAYLLEDLRGIRQVMVDKLDGISEYDIRRPLTATGTNLLGLIKHLATWESRYLGEVFDRPFPEAIPQWDNAARRTDDHWATEHETRLEIIDLYRRVWAHADETVRTLSIDAPGHVPWWPRPNVKLFNVLVHRIAETNRHVGHADILREQLDGRTGSGAEDARQQHGDHVYWTDYCQRIENAAQSATTFD